MLQSESFSLTNIYALPTLLIRTCRRRLAVLQQVLDNLTPFPCCVEEQKYLDSNSK
jgi:hypothetical protein